MARRRVNDSWNLIRVALESSRILKIDPEHVAWTHPSLIATVAKGSYVSIHPSADVSIEQIDRMQAAFYENGASAVRVVPARKSCPLVADATPRTRGETLREIAIRLVEKANTKNRVALRRLVESTLSEVGL